MFKLIAVLPLITAVAPSEVRLTVYPAHPFVGQFFVESVRVDSDVAENVPLSNR
jgi:hypothetical protein